MVPSLSLSETSLRTLVETFYARIREDDLLAPIFNQAIGDRWPEHLATLTRFWCSVMLSTGAYRGNPMAVHLQLPQLNQSHLDRWLGLWQQTTSELFIATAALQLQAKAHIIGHRILETFTEYRRFSSAQA